MLNSDLHLHPDIFDSTLVSHAAMRDGLGDGLLEVAALDERVVVLSADVSESVRVDTFRQKYPGRYIEVGVAEQNLAGIAAGLAQVGKIPYIAAFSVFSPGRNWEQIRTTIALSNLPVKILGTHAGVGVGKDGATHQALEDITLMRVVPNMTLIVPADREEARKSIHAALTNNKPTYIRFARHETPVFTTDETPFSIGRAEYLWHSEHPHVVFMGAGPILYSALEAAHVLSREGVGSIVLNLHSIKPMDIERVKEAAHRARAVVSLEEHQILGGVGGTIAEILAQNEPYPMEMVAVHDRFGQSGTADELLREYRLDTRAVMEAARRVLTRRT